jgi:hypothetical protein
MHYMGAVASFTHRVQIPRHALTKRLDELQLQSGRFEEKTSFLCQESNQSPSDVNRVA